MKKTILFFATVLLLGASNVKAQTSGECGDHLTWTVSNYILTISGTGDMWDYGPDDDSRPTWSNGFEVVLIEDGVTSIGSYAFYNNNYLWGIAIGSDVTSIGEKALYHCSLEGIGVSENNAAYTLEDGVLFNKDKTTLIRYTAVEDGKPGESERDRDYAIPGSVTSIGEEAFFYASYLESITIPDGVTNIGEGAFSQCRSLSSIIIPDNVTSIGNETFFHCSRLASIIIPDNVTSIGDNAFSNCGLTSLTIGNGVKSIGNGAFFNCYSLVSLTIPNNVTSIENYAFSNSYSLASITIGNSVTSIGEGAFSQCSSLSSIIIPNSVTSIGDWAFFECYALTSLTIPDNVTSIGEGAFSDCGGLTSVTIPNSVKSIGDGAFSYCDKLASVTIGNGVTSIGDEAFYRCRRLTSFTVGRNVTEIGESAFEECVNLSEIHNNSSVPQSINNDCFTGVNTTGCFLYVPTGSKVAYQTAMGWRSFQNIYEENVSAIGEINPSAIRVYSDPATGSLRIEGLTAPAQVTVITAGGQTVWRQTVREGENIATGYLPSGVYLVHVNGQTVKIIK